MREKYKDYMDGGMITVAKKTVFTDVDGFLNDRAFRDFVENLNASDKYYLVCINVDLTTSNETKGYAFGTRVMRNVYLQLRERFFIFRVSGNKFNLLVAEDDLSNAEKMLNSNPPDLFTIYYGIARNAPISKDNISQLRRTGAELMYQNKMARTNKRYEEIRDDVIVGDKGNTPPELQETDTHKFRETMWYGTMNLKETVPNVREVTAYIFPTEYKEKMMSLHQIVVVDDLINTRVMMGNNVVFGFDGMKFNVTSRFDNEGHLNIVCFKDKESQGNCEIALHSHEGSCVPASFGKRVGNGKELFPIKPTPYGTYSYVLWDKEKGVAEYDETGIIKMDGKNYAVLANEEGIDLILQ